MIYLVGTPMTFKALLLENANIGYIFTGFGIILEAKNLNTFMAFRQLWLGLGKDLAKCVGRVSLNLV